MSVFDIPGDPGAAMGFDAGLGTGVAGTMAPRDAAVRAAIARAADASGVDFSYLLAEAEVESKLDPSAHSATSSASGLYQFTDATWATTLARHGDALGLDMPGLAVPGASGALGAALGDPARRARLMALRDDPDAAALMAAALTSDNRQALTEALGRAPGANELYLAHFLGAEGATRFLAALGADPSQAAAALFPAAAASNHAVFYAHDGTPRSLSGVMALLGDRLSAAMGAGEGDLTMMPVAGLAGVLSDTPDPEPTPALPTNPLAREFALTAAAHDTSAYTPSSQAAGGSMADTLAATFGLGDGGDGAGEGAGAITPAFVRGAYGRLRGLGL